MLSRFQSLDQLGPSRTLSSVVTDISKHSQRFLITLSFKTILFLFSVYVFMCVYNICVCVYVEGRGYNRVCSSITFHLVYFVRASHWTLSSLIWLDWLASEPHKFYCLHRQDTGSSCLYRKHFTSRATSQPPCYFEMVRRSPPPSFALSVQSLSAPPTTRHGQPASQKPKNLSEITTWFDSRDICVGGNVSQNPSLPCFKLVSF